MASATEETDVMMNSSFASGTVFPAVKKTSKFEDFRFKMR